MLAGAEGAEQEGGRLGHERPEVGAAALAELLLRPAGAARVVLRADAQVLPYETRRGGQDGTGRERKIRPGSPLPPPPPPPTRPFLSPLPSPSPPPAAPSPAPNPAGSPPPPGAPFNSPSALGVPRGLFPTPPPKHAYDRGGVPESLAWALPRRGQPCGGRLTGDEAGGQRGQREAARRQRLPGLRAAPRPADAPAASASRPVGGRTKEERGHQQQRRRPHGARSRQPRVGEGRGGLAPRRPPAPQPAGRGKEGEPPKAPEPSGGGDNGSARPLGGPPGPSAALSPAGGQADNGGPSGGARRGPSALRFPQPGTRAKGRAPPTGESALKPGPRALTFLPGVAYEELRV